MLDVVEAVGLMDDSLIRAGLRGGGAGSVARDAGSGAPAPENEQQLQASLQSDQRRFLVNEEQARLDLTGWQHETEKVELSAWGAAEAAKR